MSRRDDSPTTGKKRPYRLGARGVAAEATRQRILEVAGERFLAASYDDVSLEEIAERAEVALKTVLRHFQSKDGLLLAAGRALSGVETEERQVTPGDVAGAAALLAQRYESLMDMTLRYLAVESRVSAVAALLGEAREAHWAWLVAVFEPFLPAKKSSLHRQRVAELFAATEIYAWHAWRRRFGLSRNAAESALREMLEALTANWKASDAE